MELKEKIKILSDAAKYDVSCSSSGSNRKNKGGLGNASQSGICHSWSEDGRCISLLKILFTNHCIYDCNYCINAKSVDSKRAAFTVDEVVDLTINFYKRNYIEGLFLSSGIFKSCDYTMEKLIEVAKRLRQEENFNGYIHMKAIPGASQDLIKELGRYVDRMSINIELPTEKSLALLAPEKSLDEITRPMDLVSKTLKINKLEKKKYKKFSKKDLFLPAGQTSQMIVGAGDIHDRDVLTRSQSLYDNYNLKRVYYSAYVPVREDSKLPKIKTPLIREHRIYQADFLLRFYGFRAGELLSESKRDFDLNLDPKMDWAIENYSNPTDINKASLEELLKVPGFGPQSARKIVRARRAFNLSLEDLKKLRISTKRALNFITISGKYYGRRFDSKEALRSLMVEREGGEQLSFLD
ncbi:putative DNA modification/repair radical SAM protein [Peptoniphilus harei]|uniref:Putative DNA modification/repair radical SAM protein n=1 Tax=Peptoniphilus harei TaxID=54005 RepID=A0A2X1XVF5_9FIRM|nr:putative DNA modification/repair radical SAM protein [Peptoniphilus harei]QQT90407.1 putative DNA modification/repair radical SAM protein [Peptoniphilus harei]SPY47628.1 putative DNA modification/repair radical SAM protein [Peptoniphilus harei]